MELEDHNCWAIAEAVGHRGPHRLQHLLSRAVWDDQRVTDIASAWAASYLDAGDAVLVVDETADEKSSANAVGAARQYSGIVGGIAPCQVAVTLTYATGCGHALIGRALYLPEGCAADEEHRELAGHRPRAAPAPTQHRHPAAPARPGPPAALVGLAAPPPAPRPPKPTNAGTPTPRQHHDHNELQLP